jgi:hypothetical protein
MAVEAALAPMNARYDVLFGETYFKSKKVILRYLFIKMKNNNKTAVY